ncbi:trypsin-like serine protease [Pontibacillus yanchengensis]|uniref:Trypsin-like serine protease n=2 Tax=Pontibacillus yanchengensis TaxID=462910 RepID=A0A6I5A463_9BACI|nr:trypsin-like peptidase domain-containing protein [Pontibacillus yanchengensis]MYL34789.1 trypsin-like serine protease [Pontibacillus yanchengensis]MYL52225.1 trypsin-like serine protease [Pontibacillus yanchengensis]
MNNKHLTFPILLTILVVVFTAFGVYWLNNTVYKQSITATSTLAQEVNKENTSTSIDMKTIIHEAEKNVVQIEAKAEWGENIGSGFLFNDKGDIITNAHVVKDAETVQVTTANAQTFIAAVVGIGKETDIAVIRVPSLANRTPMTIGTNTDVEIGDEIIAVGSPLGLQNTVTTGIVSGKGRDFEIDEFKYVNAFQISAPITHGNSGGPLIHRQTGKIIAINSAGTNQGGIGFSIPLSDVMDQVTSWSEQADSKDLVYKGSLSSTTIDTKKLKEDARYLYSYFNESLLMRDYISAYGMLGSEWQAKQSYTQFRDMYVHTTDITISNVQVNINEHNQVKLTLTSDHVIRKEDQQKVTERYNSTYTIGYENDQLKLLNSKRELVSTTTHLEDSQNES